MSTASNLSGWLNAGLGTSDVVCYGNLTVLGGFSAGNSNVTTVNGCAGAITLNGTNGISVASNVTTDVITLTGAGTESAFQSYFYRFNNVYTDVNPFTLSNVYATLGSALTPYTGLIDNAGTPQSSPITVANPRVSGVASLFVNFGTATLTGASTATLKLSLYESNTPPTNDMLLFSNDITVTVTNGQPLVGYFSVPFVGGFSNGATPTPTVYVGYLVTGGASVVSFASGQLSVALSYSPCFAGAVV